jgi:hypothetical protein
VSWVLTALLGALGGILVSVITFGSDLHAWSTALRFPEHRGTAHPSLREYVRPLADVLVLLVRVILGAAAGALFRDQIVAAVEVGAGAPVLLSQFIKGSALGPARRSDDTDGRPAGGGFTSQSEFEGSPINLKNANENPGQADVDQTGLANEYHFGYLGKHRSIPQQRSVSETTTAQEHE